MTEQDREVIKEVIEATRVHMVALSNSCFKQTKLTKDTVDDVLYGMKISVNKLECLLGKEENIKQKKAKNPNKSFDFI